MVVINMPIMMLIVYGTIIAVMWFGGQMVFAGSLEAGKLITFFTYITQIMISLMMVSMIFMMMTRSIACARRIREVLEERPAITDDRAVTDTDDSGLPSVKDSSIDFDHVFFKYRDQPEWVLKDEHPHSQRSHSGHFGRQPVRQDQPHEPDPGCTRQEGTRL